MSPPTPAEARPSGVVRLGAREFPVERVRLAVAGITAVVVAVLVALLVDPVSRQESHQVRGWLAGVGIGLAWARLALGRLGPRLPARALEALRRIWLAALASTSVVAVFAYFQFDRDVFEGINDYTDTAYYYTNSKYLAELGYDGLYAGALLCDSERGSPRTKGVQTVRDLRDDELRSRRDELKHGREVKGRFTPERWTAFCGDMTFFLDHLDKDSLEDNFFVDHGYNPPPTWTIVGGNLCWLVGVEQLKWICSVDTVLVALMFGGIGYAFGAEVLGFSVLFWAITFSGRWPILGMAILRFDWVVALAASVCLLKLQRYGAAGAALAYAAMNRVFPAIFFWGWLVEAAIDTWRERRVPPKHLRFAAGAGIVTLLLVGGSVAQYGADTLGDSARSLQLHNESFSSHRVGLGTVMVWDHETTREEIREHGTMRAKELAVQEMKWGLRGTGILACGFLAVIAAALAYKRRDAPAWEMVTWVGWPLFCATTPQVNYYNFRLVSYLWHGDGVARSSDRGRLLEDIGHTVLLSLLLGTEAAAQAAQVHEWERHAVNAVTSWGMLAYFAAMVAFLVARAVAPEARAQEEAAPAPPVAPPAEVAATAPAAPGGP